jgi:hypothetical protein
MQVACCVHSTNLSVALVLNVVIWQLQLQYAADAHLSILKFTLQSEVRICQQDCSNREL